MLLSMMMLDLLIAQENKTFEQDSLKGPEELQFKSCFN